MLKGPPQQDAAPDHLHLGGVDQPPQGGLQEGLQLVQVQAGGGRRCCGFMKSFITLSFSKDFLQ